MWFHYILQKFKLIPLLVLVTILLPLSKEASAQILRERYKAVCPSEKGNFKCSLKVVVDDQDQAITSEAAAPAFGYTAHHLRKAYNLMGSYGSKEQIIAIVTAFDHPFIFYDLNKYSQAVGIPQIPKCNGPIKDSPVSCFQKVDQNGGTNYPAFNQDWALETALDVQMAHGICWRCKILLVEANVNSYYDMMPAINKAIELGATVVSNSYGTEEFDSQNQFDSYLNHPGVAITFSSGDGGFNTTYPASSRFVTAVGGTTLLLNPDGTRQSETAWFGSGSGCSLFESKQSWQTDSLCGKRMVADVSAVGDPATGVAIYSSAPYHGSRGWFKVGGTSASSPIIAGVYGLAQGTQAERNSVPYLNGNSTNLYDITSGSNGSCGESYLCTGVVGYDGPTGLGSPKGLGAF